MIDTDEDIAPERIPNRSGLALEFSDPLRIVGNDAYGRITSVAEAWVAF